jgi:4-hydroxy-tetrahydrodipicolinate synthase
MSERIRGVLAPVVTPFKADLAPDSQQFIAHCKWLLSHNCGLAVFGTNSEANSLSIDVLNAVAPVPRFTARDALS